MTNFKKIATFLTEKDLWGKPFNQFTAKDISDLVEVVLEANNPGGWSPPYIEGGLLTIPFNAPRKYRWWDGGQTIMETLTEIGADEETKKRYL